MEPSEKAFALKSFRFVLFIIAIVTACLNLRPRPSHYPDTLADVWDAPYMDPKLVQELEDDEYNAVQYGWPFNAYEYWSHQRFPHKSGSQVLLGAFGNAFIFFLVFCVAFRSMKALEAGGKPNEAPT